MLEATAIYEEELPVQQPGYNVMDLRGLELTQARASKGPYRRKPGITLAGP